VTEGVEVRMLSTYDDQAGYAALFRFAPGARLPTHQHLGRVHAFTLSGRWRYLEHDWVATPGSYALEPSGSVHTLEVPADATEPAVVLFVSEGAMVLVAEDGAPQLIWDTRAMIEIYRSALAGRGVAAPEGIA
jgi:quercetin dioxygenase-like cupin family protein